MSRHQFVSINRIFSKLIRDVTDDFNEGDVIEWCGEALEFIQATRSYEEAVAFIEVKNHQCKLPGGTHAIIQIARNNAWRGPLDDSFCPASIVGQNFVNGCGHHEHPHGCGCGRHHHNQNDSDLDDTTPIAINCEGLPQNAFDVAYYRPYFDLKWEYQFWYSCGTYREKYTPVRLSTNSFFNSLVCTEVLDGRDHIYQHTMDEYTIINGDTLRFSFREGSVAVAYLRQVLDEETGYPMIPDNISYTTAITKYITMKKFERDFYSGRQGAGEKMKKAEADWHWYCKQASNADMMPYGVDEYQNLLDQRSYILPQQLRYFGFFGKMNQPENRKYNDPDLRNWRGYYFRGN